MWSPMQSARLAGALVQALRGFVFMWLLQALIQMEAGGWRMLERVERVGGEEWGVMQLLFAWCRAPLAADKHLWTSQAACNKQHGWCHRSLCGLGANWSATCSARSWMDVSRVENLETSPARDGLATKSSTGVCCQAAPLWYTKFELAQHVCQSMNHKFCIPCVRLICKTMKIIFLHIFVNKESENSRLN